MKCWVLVVVLGFSLALPAGVSVAKVDKEKTNRCVYAGQEYSEGSLLEQGGITMICQGGKWEEKVV